MRKELRTSQKAKLYEFLTKVLKIGTWVFIVGGLILGAALLPTVSLAAAVIAACGGTFLGLGCKTAANISEVYENGYKAEYVEEQLDAEARAKAQEITPHELSMPEYEKQFEEQSIIIADKNGKDYEITFPKDEEFNR